MESTIRLHDGHYDTALPWSNFPPRLPNNRLLAEHRSRLMLLKKSFSRIQFYSQSMLISWMTYSTKTSLERFRPNY